MTKIESGRSMVEMLGVLAIIGVLSIGGIAGYTIAMNRYRANEILDLASKVAVLGMTKQGTDTASMTVDLGVSSPIHGVNNMTAGSDGVVTITWNDPTNEDHSAIQSAMNTIAGNKYDKTKPETFNASAN